MPCIYFSDHTSHCELLHAIGHHESYDLKRLRLMLAAVLLASSVRAADPVVITDSGSTNTAGFRIEVGPSGDAVYTPKPRRAGPGSQIGNQAATQHLPSALFKRFLADLDAAKPLPELPSRGCMKSASFGTTLIIEYQAQQTPDLRCVRSRQCEIEGSDSGFERDRSDVPRRIGRAPDDGPFGSRTMDHRFRGPSRRLCRLALHSPAQGTFHERVACLTRGVSQ